MRAEICRLVDKLETSVHADMSEPAVYQVEGGCGMHCRQCRRCSVPSGGQCEHNVEMVPVTHPMTVEVEPSITGEQEPFSLNVTWNPAFNSCCGDMRVCDAPGMYVTFCMTTLLGQKLW